MTITHYPRLIITLLCCLSVWGCVPASTDDRWKIANPVERAAPTLVKTAPIQQQGNDFHSLPPVKVAILLPLTGPKAAMGQSMLQAAQLALFDIGYTSFNLMPRDTKGTPDGASAAATTAINDGAQLILGPVFAHSVRAVKTITRPQNINVIAFSTDKAQADRATFMMGFMPFSQVDRIADYTLSKGIRNYALIAPRDRYGDMVSDKFTKAVQRQNGTISQSIRFSPGDPAVINQVQTLNKENVQAVFMPVGGSQVEAISSALSYNKMMPSQIKRLGTGLWDDPRIAKQPNMQGAWFAAPSPASRRRFEQKYKDTYGQSPIRLATLSYDATALAAVFARNGFSRSSRPDFTYEAITNRNGFAGVDGVFRFKNNGVIERALSVLEIREGRIVEIDPAPRKF